MGRRQKVLVGTDAMTDLARSLRRSRAAAGLTLRGLATKSGYAHSTLSMAESGSRLPSWEVVEAFVQACGDDPATWRDRWEVAATGTPGVESAEHKRRTRKKLVRAGGVLVTAALGIATGLLWPRADQPAPPGVQLADGQDPYRNGCGQDQVQIDSRPLSWPGGTSYGSLVMFHSSKCHASWGYVYGPNSSEWTVHIQAHRDSDRATVAAELSAAISRPNSWGDALLSNTGCVYIEAYITKGGVDGPPTATNCYREDGTVIHAR